ncbi:hypothetical protein V8E53_000923 [Lactarius tabidus]
MPDVPDVLAAASRQRHVPVVKCGQRDIVKSVPIPQAIIIRSNLLISDFALLSAFHTAEVTEESLTDEVLHPAAAVQFCEFRSVVGTIWALMWAMVDEDGRGLAEHF